MAILCGGDYDKVSLMSLFQVFAILFQLEVGLKGCGWKTARFLHDWRPKLRTLLAHDPQKILGRRYPLLTKNITDTFPSVDIVLQYARPLTSWTIDRIPDTKSWQLQPPYLTKIATLCEKYFSWGSSGDIVSRFKETLWPGITI